MLLALNFNICFPTSYRFLQRYARLARCEDIVVVYSRYLMELALMDVKMNKWNPSLLACGAIYMSKKILHQRKLSWNSFMT